MLLTCHTPGYDAERLDEMVKEHFFAGAVGCMKGEAAFDSRRRRTGVAQRRGRAVESEAS